MAKLVPYINFYGKTREALDFYKQAFGGGELNIMSMEESPMADQLPADQRDHVMHSEFNIGDVCFMATDMHEDEKKHTSQMITLSLNCESEEEINRLFKNLSQGGKIETELKTEFWGGIFGLITDKYGIRWMFNYQKA